MPCLRTVLVVMPLACLLAGTAFAQPSDDPLQSPACLVARQRLDAAQPQGMTPQMRALRQQVADACLRARADPPRAARPTRPAEAVPATVAPPPRVSVPSSLPAPTVAVPPQPAQVTRCDAGGCWDNSGQRLNRSGNQLLNPQGKFCTQQGTVLVCP